VRSPFGLEGRYDDLRTVALTYRRGNNFDQCVSRDITTRDDAALNSGAAAFPYWTILLLAKIEYYRALLPPLVTGNKHTVQIFLINISLFAAATIPVSGNPY
jgi:hypothetical protein